MAASSLLPEAFELASPLHDDKLRTSFPLNYSRTQFPFSNIRRANQSTPELPVAVLPSSQRSR